MKYHGYLLQESLADTTVLDKLTITTTEMYPCPEHMKADYMDDEHISPIDWTVSRFDSPSHVERVLRKMAAKTVKTALPVLATITNPETALVALRERQHAHYEGLGFLNWAQHPIAFAFTLRKVGDIEAARDEFAHYVETHTGMIPQQVLDKLRKAFDNVQPEGQ